MVIKDVHQRIRFFLLQPALQRFEALEDPRTMTRVLLFVMIDRGKTDSRYEKQQYRQC